MSTVLNNPVYAALLALLLLALAAALALLLLRRQRRAAGALAAADARLDQAGFGAAIAQLFRERFARSRYDTPCILVCGESGCGKSAILQAAGMERTATGAGRDSGWWSNMDGTAFELPDIPRDAQRAERIWRDTLALFEKHRPRRALDALVWVLPLPALQQPGEAGERQLAELGAAMAERFFDIQDRLGLRLPVYLIISKCDHVTGFAAFASALPQALREKSLGWSNSYALGSSFQESWAEQGLAALMRRLRSVIDELGAQADTTADFDQIFLLPDRLAQALDRLPALLQQTFRQNARLECFELRGLWLSGRATLAPSAPAVSADPFARTPEAGPPAQEQPAFCRQLFAGRIYAEFGLAQLGSHKLTGDRVARRRLLWISGGAAGLWLAGMLFAHAYAIRIVEQMTPPLLRLRAVILTPPALRSHDSTVALLQSMDRVPDWTLSTVFMPASWFSSVDQRIGGVLRMYYEDVLFSSMDSALAERAHAILGSQSDPMLEDDAAAPRPDRLPEFVTLERFVERATLYEVRRSKFVSLVQDGQGSWADVAGLLSYLFDITPAPRSHASENLFNQVLRRSTYRKPEAAGPRQRQFAQRLASLHQAWMAQLFGQNQLAAASDAVAAALVALNQAQPNQREALDQLQQAIARLRKRLLRIGPVGGVDGAPDLGEGYQALLKKIERSELLGGAANGAALRAIAQESHRTFWNDVRDHASGDNPVLDHVRGKSVQLRSDVTELEKAIERMLQQPFFQVPAFAPHFDDSALAEWDGATLTAAETSYQELLAFETAELGRAPLRFAGALQKMAREQTAALMDARMSQAAHSARMGSEGWRNPGFQPAARQLAGLIGSLRKLGSEQRAARWARRVDQQAGMLLAAVDAQFEREQPYLPHAGAIAAWDGRRSGAQRAYGVSTPAELQDYLATQLARISALAEASKAPRAWLAQGGDGGDALQARWQGLQLALEQYAARSPAASLRQLEQLISVDLNTLERQSCGEKLAQTAPGRDTDFFHRREVQLLSLFGQRCAQLQAQAAQEAYLLIAEQFNRRLAGRYPFSALADAPVAEPGEVRDFLRLLDVHLATARTGLSPGWAADGASELAFLDRLERMRPLLNAMLALDPVTGAPATLDLWPEFRINRAREQGADQLLEWRLAAGETWSSTRPAPAAPPQWRLGEPLTSTLRWAKDGPLAPSADLQRYPALQIDGDSAIWHYSGPWALLRLLAAHAAPASELEARVAMPPQALRFSAPTRYRDALPGADAIVYARLGITVHGKPERLALPSFPARAPPLRLER